MIDVDDFYPRIGLFKQLLYRSLLNRIRGHWQLRRQPPELMHQWQFRKIQRLVRYAYDFVPMYRRLYSQAGLEPEDVRSWNDFARLPVIHRELLQQYYPGQSLTTRLSDLRYQIDDSTSGTTGTPFTFMKDHRTVDHEYLTFTMQKLRLGWKFSDKELYLKGLLEDADPQNSVFMRIDKNTYRWNGFEIFGENTVRLSNFIKEKNIWFIYGYPTPIKQMCKLIRERGLEIQVPLVITMGEVLSESTRMFIQNCLGARVYQLYGAAEVMQVAHECREQNGLHIDLSRYYLELKNPKRRRAGIREGSVVITDLLNYVMPLIRYEIGDEVQMTDNECPCGDRFPRILKIKGKQQDIIHTAGGRELNLHILLDDVFADLGGEIDTFRFVVESEGRYRLQIKPRKQREAAFWQPIVRDLQHYLGENAEIVFEQVYDIPLEASGKRKNIVDRRRRP